MMNTMIKGAVAAALAAAMGSAQALTPDTNPTPDLHIYISGASAQDANFENVVSDAVGSMCADVPDYFRDNQTATPGANYRVAYCTVSAATVPGLSGTLKIMFHKRSAGGSGQGVGPVADGTAIAFMEMSSTDFTNCTLSSAHNYSCTPTLGNHVPDGGLSDVEPALFRGPNAINGVDVSAAQVANLNAASTTALVFGITVTKELRDALQRSEGLVAGAEDEANMPTLTRSQLASIFSGSVRTWDKFVFNGVPLNALANQSVPLVNSQIHICRRTAGSGTQATINANILNVPCSSTGTSPATSNGIGGPVVVQNSGTGDLENCLVAANNGTAYTAPSPGTGSFAANASQTRWAIGLSSLERNSNNSKPFRFIKVDGVAPTLANAVTGKYLLVAENSMQWRKTTNAPTGDILTLLTKFRTDLGKDTIVRDQDAASYVYSFGPSGYLALTTNGYNVDPDADNVIVGDITSNPVTPFSRAFGTVTNVSNCRTPAIWNNTKDELTK